MKKTLFISTLCSLLLISCSQKSNTGSAVIPQDSTKNAIESAMVSGEKCDVTINNIPFSKSINKAASSVSVQENGKVIFEAGGKSDYFSDPNGKLSNTSAPILLTVVDNTKPFTFSAKVTPGFAVEDLYNAGVLYVYVNDLFFQKHCYEQDERGKHRVVTVQTYGTSDDSNHDVVEQDYVYLKISSDSKTIASYYSLDNVNWQMVRLYENNYPDQIWLGISSQCPKGKGNKSIFEEITLTDKNVSDFRMGL